MALSKPLCANSLLRYAVPVRELTHATHAFRCELDFHLSPGKDKRFLTLKQLLVTLLNGCGGLIHLDGCPSSPVDHRTMDTWKTQLDDFLNFIPGRVYEDCCRLKECGSSLMLLVDKSPEPVTMETHMYIRLTAKNRYVYERETIQKISEQNTVCTQQVFGSLDALKVGDTFPYVENQNVEFKDWKIQTVNDFVGKLSNARTVACLFAFPNIYGGGHFFIGIREDKQENVVVGVKLEQAEEEQFRSIFQSYLEADPKTQTPRVWGSGGGRPVEGVDWEATFHEVQQSAAGRKVLIHVHIKQYPGGVCTSKPLSYSMREDGTPYELSFDEWRHSMVTCRSRSESYEKNGNDKLLTSLAISKPGSMPAETNHHRSEQESSVEPQCSPSVPAVRHKTSILRSMFSSLGKQRKHSHISEKDISRGIKSTDRLSWSSHSSDWTKSLTLGSVDMKENIRDLAHISSLFQPRRPLNVTPTENALVACIGNGKDIRRLFNEIDASLGQRPAFAIASESWMQNFEHRAVILRPKDHIMDIFVVDDRGNTHMWCVFTGTGQQEEHWVYVVSLARWMKLHMLTCQVPEASSIKSQQVDCHLFTLTGEVRHADQTVPNIDSNKLSYIQIVLATRLIEKNTRIKSKLGLDMSIHLTSIQMQCILSSDCIQFNMIEGAPGSGKSYLACYLCAKYGKENTLYLCGTKPFYKLLEFYNNCCPVLIEDDEGVLDITRNGGMETKSCIIIDDGHHLSCKSSTWNKLFDHIRHIGAVRLFILLDNEVQNYLKRSTLRQCFVKYCMQHDIPFQSTPLTTVHRNSRKVVSFMKSNMGAGRQCKSNMLSCSLQEDGDDVEVRTVSNLRLESADNSLVLLLKEITDSSRDLSAKSRQYQPEDVAILVDTPQTEVDCQLFMNILQTHYPESKPQDACTYPVVRVRIEKLEDFMGIDTQVCICIPAARRRSKNKVTFSCFRYRNYMASRGIYRVIFLKEAPLDTDTVRNMQLDNPPFVQPRPAKEPEMAVGVRKLLHTCRGALIYDVMMLTDEKGPVIVYTEQGNKHLVAMTILGVPITSHPLLTATADILFISRVCRSRDEQQVALIHRVREHWICSVLNRDGGSWNLHHKHQLPKDNKPRGIVIRDNGDLLLHVYSYGTFKDKTAKHMILCVDAAGEERWRRDTTLSSSMVSHKRLTAAPSGHIYMTDPDAHRVHVFDAEGQFRRSILDPEVYGIWIPEALCLSGGGAYLCVGHTDENYRSMVSMVSPDGSQIRFLAETPRDVYCLAVYGDKYLAVGTDEGGMLLYDISVIMKPSP